MSNTVKKVQLVMVTSRKSKLKNVIDLSHLRNNSYVHNHTSNDVEIHNALIKYLLEYESFAFIETSPNQLKNQRILLRLRSIKKGRLKSYTN